MKFEKNSLLFLLLLLLLSSQIYISSFALPNYSNLEQQVPLLDFYNLINSIDMDSVIQHVRFFSSLGTRATGYAGNLIASQYIYDKFVEYKLENVSFQEFDVVDAISHEATITIQLKNGSEVTLKLHPMLPNFVVPSVTPPEGLTGKIIYAGKGYLKDFPKEDITDSIVLMEWYSENNWINAAKLGAKAIIFLPPEHYLCDPYGNRIAKFLPEVPLYLPRFYVEDRSILMNSIGCKATIRSVVRWERVITRNIMGLIKGTVWPNQILVLSAHYDSYSYSPSLAPGARESIGIAALLELAKYFSEHPPERTIFFVAFGGHHQALEGARRWVFEYLEVNTAYAQHLRYNITVQLNLDLSTGSESVYATIWSYLSGFGTFSQPTSLYDNVGKLMQDIVIALNKVTGKSYSFILGDMYRGMSESFQMESVALPTKCFIWDHEPLNDAAKHNSLSLVTAFDPRPFLYTPFDVFDTITERDLFNLRRQLELIRCIIVGLVKSESLSNYLWGWTGTWLPYSLKGKVVVYNPATDWYDPVPNAIVYTRTLPYNGWYPHARRFTLADENGNFEFKYGYGSWVTCYGIGPTYVYAWVINSSGHILYGPDVGIHMLGTNSPVFSGPDLTFDMGFLTVCEASTIVIFDVVVPDRLFLYQSEMAAGAGTPEQRITGYLIPFARLYEAGSGVPIVSGGWWMPHPEVCILYCVVPPETSIAISIYDGSGSIYPSILLTNASEASPLGVGYKLKQGQQLRIYNSFLTYAENFYWINEERFRSLISVNPAEAKSEAYEIHMESNYLILMAKTEMKNFEFLKAYILAHQAWLNEAKNYAYLRTKIIDSSTVFVIMSFLLIPFILIAEKILFSFGGRNKIFSLAVLFALYMTALYFLYPGTKLITNSLMVVVGSASFILSLPLIWVTWSRTIRFFRELREKVLGKHIVDITRLSAAFHSFQVGVENVKKSKFRSILTMISLIILVSSLVNLLSVEVTGATGHFEWPRGNDLYRGIYIRKFRWGFGFYSLTEQLVEVISGRYSDKFIVAPRAWLYTAYPTRVQSPFEDTSGKDYSPSLKVFYNGKYIEIKALLGLSLQESEVSHIDYFIIHGLWFISSETPSCILTEKQAEILGIKASMLPTTVLVEGTPFQIIGIIDSDYYQLIRDIDGEEITPLVLDFVGVNPYDVHNFADDILIANYNSVIALGGRCACIALKLKTGFDERLILQTADEISKLMAYEIYFNVRGKIFVARRGVIISLQRWETAILPMAIVILSVSNIFIGLVYERKSHIRTYASLGLSPFHIGFMFFAEALVFSIVGSVLAYLAALLQMRWLAPAIGTFMINPSSSVVVMALLLSMLAMILSSIIPSLMASKIVTPSLERTWKIPTSPILDRWDIPLPFVFSSEKEVRAIINYIKEFFEAHLGEEALEFAVKNLKVSEGELEGVRYIEISAETRLHPYELGVVQMTILRMAEVKPEVWNLQCLLIKMGGSQENWIALNKRFLTLLREQLLLWKSLPPADKEKYFASGGEANK